MERLRAHHEFVGIFRRVALRISRTVFSALSGMRLLACLIVAPQRGYDEPAILSYAISSFCPTSADGLQPLIATTSQRGLAPRPAHVSPEGLRYFGGTFLPFNALPPPRTILRLPTTPIPSNCLSSSARRSESSPSTRSRRSMSASTVIPDRFIFAIVISGAKTELSVRL